MNIQSWCNREIEIAARRERTVNKIMNAVFWFAFVVMGAEFFLSVLR